MVVVVLRGDGGGNGRAGERGLEEPAAGESAPPGICGGRDESRFPFEAVHILSFANVGMPAMVPVPSPYHQSRK
jgi:hypothetical protein